MKICVMCPGSFTHGLDSPERGESRWSQNYAKMLAKIGHEVYAASMGLPIPAEHYGVRLISELDVATFGPYDIYIDSSWWREKTPKGKARKYICLKWSVETYMREEDFPDNFYFAYPYPSHHWEFATFRNAHKSFALPTWFGEFQKPNWDKEKIFLPGKIDLNRDYQRFLPAVGEFLSQHPIEGVSRTFFEQHFSGIINFNRPDSSWHELQSYNKVIESIRRSKLSIPILNPGCIIEAAMNGVPSIFWEHGGFFNPLGQSLSITIPHDGTPERFTEVAEMLMSNKKKYCEVVRTCQDYFSGHTYEGAMRYWEMMIEEIF